VSRQEQRSEWLRAGTFPEPLSVQHLIERASDIAVYIGKDGIVEGISVNADCPSLGCLDHWVGRTFIDFLTPESQTKFNARIRELQADPETVLRSTELNHVDNATWEFPIKYSLHRVDGGAILMLGRDMQPIAEVQQRLVNEQMARERDLQKLRSEETFYRVVLEASETPLVLVEPESGRVRDLNTAAALLFGTKAETIGGNVFAQTFEGRRRREFTEALQASASAEETKAVEVVARRNSRVVRLYPDLFRAAGELFLICRVEPVDDNDMASPQAAHSLAALFASTSDAIVLTDAKGVIRDANEAFLIMADAAQLRDVKDMSLADFLVRGGIDLKLVLETAVKQGRLPNYQAQFKSVVGTRANVDLSVARLRRRGGELGFGFIIRNVVPSAMPENDAGAIMSEEAMKNVMDLVGTASLKELVAATSDVVEKMCIETATQLTDNNRVAAAEMLGLSRQSLYVKLRKYGLLNSDRND